MNRMPSEVWAFITNQIKYYPLRKADLTEEMRRINEQYLLAGGDRMPDPTGIMGTDVSCPTMTRYEQMEQQLLKPYTWYLATCVQRLEDSRKGMEAVHQDVLEAVWDIGWRDNEALAKAANVSKSTVIRAKREIIERLAVRWGMWSA